MLALVVAAVVIGVLGALMERFYIRRLYRQELDQVLLTFGFALIVIGLFAALIIWLLQEGTKAGASRQRVYRRIRPTYLPM